MTPTRPLVLCINEDLDVTDALSISMSEVKLFDFVMISSPIQALIEISFMRPSVIMFDCDIQELPCHEFVKAVRKRADMKTLPIIIMCDRFQDDNALNLCDNSYTSIVAKPIDPYVIGGCILDSYQNNLAIG